ncbi:unnamed protein product [Coregonus sp. 'balchen']|nr:unnamed protein product [Coregonus sp. 'balchen']
MADKAGESEEFLEYEKKKAKGGFRPYGETGEPLNTACTSLTTLPLSRHRVQMTPPRTPHIYHGFSSSPPGFRIDSRRSVGSCRLCGPCTKLFRLNPTGPFTLHNWLSVKQALLLLKLAEIGLIDSGPAQSGLGTLPYLSFNDSKTVMRTTARLRLQNTVDWKLGVSFDAVSHEESVGAGRDEGMTWSHNLKAQEAEDEDMVNLQLLFRKLQQESETGEGK